MNIPVKNGGVGCAGVSVVAFYLDFCHITVCTGQEIMVKYGQEKEVQWFTQRK